MQPGDLVRVRNLAIGVLVDGQVWHVREDDLELVREQEVVVQ